MVTNGTLDRETNDRHELFVTCSDNGQPPLTSTVSIVIVVDDVNDNAPKFLQMDYDVRVKENMATLEVSKAYNRPTLQVSLVNI